MAWNIRRDQLTSERRVRTSVPCGICGKPLVVGSANFYYSTRDRSRGRIHVDCTQSASWNPLTGEIEDLSKITASTSSMNTSIISKFDNVCPICGKPIRRGLDWVKPVPNQLHKWAHKNCIDELEETQENSPTTVPQAPVTPIPLHEEPKTQWAQSWTQNEPQKPSVPNPDELIAGNTGNTPQEPKTPVAPISQNPLIDLIWDSIKDRVAKSADINQIADMFRETFQSQFEALADQLKASQVVTHEVIINRIEEHIKVKLECVHPRFNELLPYAVARESVYLHGPAGSGKTTLAMQVAEALGLPFFTISLSQQSTPTLLLGYCGIGIGKELGPYQTTSFRECWEHGGLFLIDEMDNCSGNLLTTLNTGLANRMICFPDSPIPVKQHENNIVWGAGNTVGLGANKLYNERKQLDAATRDRFAFEEIALDESFEMQCALAVNPNATEWIKRVQNYRAKAKAAGLRIEITPRASIKGAKMLLHGKTIEQLERSYVFKGLEPDQIAKIR